MLNLAEFGWSGLNIAEKGGVGLNADATKLNSAELGRVLTGAAPYVQRCVSEARNYNGLGGHREVNAIKNARTLN